MLSRRQLQLRLCLRCLFLGVATLWLLGGTAAAAEVAVIANRSVPVQDVNRLQLIDIYTGDMKSWSNGKPVVVMDLKPNNDIKDTFYKFLGRTPSRMKSLWLKKLLAGEGDPPKSVETESEMIARVASTPGAIGFVSRTAVNDTVKTLAIIQPDGKMAETDKQR